MPERSFDGHWVGKVNLMNPNDLIQKGLGLAGGAAGLAQQLVKQGADSATGLYHKARRSDSKDLDDVTITRKVESIVFRNDADTKSSVEINTVDGVVYLRGTLKRAEQISALEEAVRAIPEVKDVENLISQPKTPKKQPTGRFKKEGEKPVRRGKFTDDRTSDIVDEAEATPKAKAAKREGRSAAPLGARGEGRKASGEQSETTKSTGDPSPSAKSAGERSQTTKPAGEAAGPADSAGSIPTPTV